MGLVDVLSGEEGGAQVATVKASTSLRMKKRGKVPPRLETLLEVRRAVGEGRDAKGESGGVGLRGEESHVGAADDGVGDLGVEGGDGDEHDGVGEGGEDVRADDCEEVP